ncbi:hypothetical protein K435DRAFT_972253 [Dendrothele bispora CBS 962.96]|uniref:Uncharacterized protein n=1 Tax=Dendrothele bispora (strain CBS 962.96) TaxID=1314807 RepID=A0A4S8L0G3_DENBC|nr:hypothetical protein K435DRAFT_972253 [Dendrothele bispora CBS 962.96]
MVKTTEEAIDDDVLFCEEEEPGELDELMEEEVEPTLERITAADVALDMDDCGEAEDRESEMEFESEEEPE